MLIFIVILLFVLNVNADDDGCECRDGYDTSLFGCIYCIEGCYVDSGDCLKCDSSCVDCKKPGSDNCTKCNEGDYLDYVNDDCGSCISCFSAMDGCNNCSSSTRCTSCDTDSGYYLNDDSCSLCSNAMDGCNTCDSLTACTACDSGYYLSNGKCISLYLNGKC
ncbi:hypothetical protein QTN25_000616 [Entamoeba marina]